MVVAEIAEDFINSSRLHEKSQRKLNEVNYKLNLFCKRYGFDESHLI